MTSGLDGRGSVDKLFNGHSHLIFPGSKGRDTRVREKKGLEEE